MRRADNFTIFMCRLSWNLGTSDSWNPHGLSRPVIGLLYQYWLDCSPCEILGYTFHYRKCISTNSGLQTKLYSCIRVDSGCLVVGTVVYIFRLVTSLYRPVLCRATRSQSACTQHRDKSHIKFCLYEVNCIAKCQ